MKSYSKLFIVVLFLLVFLASLAWGGVRYLSVILNEFDRVAQVDLGLMETATTINDLQLKKEIIFNKLSASAEELAFGQANPARAEYLADYVKGLQEEFNQYVEQTKALVDRIEKIDDVPQDFKISFEQIDQESEQYNATVQGIFKAVEKGGFELSLDDLDTVDGQQQILSEHVGTVVSRVWEIVHQAVDRTQHWHQQSRMIFAFSILLTLTLLLLLFVFRRSLEELARQKKDLETVNQELDRFVHTVSHDILGPLTIIVGYAAYLETQYSQQLDQRGRDCIQGVRKGASRLNQLIKDMLELTKMTRIKNPYSRVAIKQIVETAIANCEHLIRSKNAEIKIEGLLPEIVCDRIKTTAIFFNLISNALKFSKPDQMPVITIGWKEIREYHEFYVKDNGIGIDSGHHQDIFKIFKRLHTADQYGGGSGVGLSIVKAAIEDQGGSIRLESNVAVGTTFIFTIPKNLIPFKPLY